MRRIPPLVLGVLALLFAASACDDQSTNLQNSEEAAVAPSFDQTLFHNYLDGPPPPATVELKEYPPGWFEGDKGRLTLNSVGEVPSLLPASVIKMVAPGGTFTESKTLTVPLGWLPAAADIMFALDVTGSMGGEIANVQNNSVNIMTAVRGVIEDSKFAVMSHADYPGFTAVFPDKGDGPASQCQYCDYKHYNNWLYPWWVYGDPGTTQDPATCTPGACTCDGGDNPDPLSFEPNGGVLIKCNPDIDYAFRLDREFTDITPYLSDPWTNPVANALWSLYPIGGRDFPESSTRLLFEAYNQPVGWRDGAAKFLLYWTDAPPHACDLSLGLECDVENGSQRSTGPDPGPDGLLDLSLWTPGAEPIDPDPNNLDLGAVLQTLADEDITLIPLYSGYANPYGHYWQCYAEQTHGTSFVINSDGTMPGNEAIETYLLNKILEETERVVELSIRADAGYEDWITPPDPFSHDLGEAAIDVIFDLDFLVPEGTPDDTYLFEVCAFADGAKIVCQSVEITVESDNLPPVADPGPYRYEVEGTPVTFDGSQSYDPDGEIVSYEWDLDEDGIFDDATGPTPTYLWPDDHAGEVCLKVSDGQLDDTACIYPPPGVEIVNAAPVCGPITAPAGPVPVTETPVVITAAFTDVGVEDTHDAVWYWSSPPDPLIYTNGFVTQGAGFGTVEGTSPFTEAGVYSGGLSITDDDGDGGNCTEAFSYVVYDPSAGFVTGGGWIDSPPGAYTPGDPGDEDLTGKASFGFVSKYKKGAEIPDGNTEFQFRAGELNFHGSSYDWLVVTGNDYARFKGSGTVNQAVCPSGEDYKFQIWAGDGEPDTFRIKLWCEVDDIETVLYDNGRDQPIAGGNIMVHTKK